jgi:hypothetical protein
MKNSRLLWVGGLAAGAAALFGVGIYMANKAAASTTIPPGSGSTAGTYTVILQPGAMSATTNGLGQQVEFDLPAGASWTDNTANAAAAQMTGMSSVNLQNSGSNPSTAVYSGTTTPTTTTLSWKDSAGTAQTTTVTFS